jgi:hypothetical protein
VSGHVARGSQGIYDIFYTGLFVLFLSSIFIESNILKGLQTACVLSAGTLMMLDHSSAYVGLVILSTAFMSAYIYGFFRVHGQVKITLWAVFYLLMFIFTSSGDIIEACLWLAICTAIQAVNYIFAMDLITKAKRADELELLFLKHNLEQSIEAGLILSNELNKGPQNGCKG